MARWATNRDGTDKLLGELWPVLSGMAWKLAGAMVQRLGQAHPLDTLGGTGQCPNKPPQRCGMSNA
jgi:hypothetical protein